MNIKTREDVIKNRDAIKADPDLMEKAVNILIDGQPTEEQLLYNYARVFNVVNSQNIAEFKHDLAAGLDINRPLLKDHAPEARSTLDVIIERDAINLLNYVIESGLSFNLHGTADSMSMIQAAICSKSSRCLKKLIEIGADVNEIKDKMTPMVRAVIYENADAVRILLDADAEMSDKGYCASMAALALSNNNKVIFGHLIDYVDLSEGKTTNQLMQNAIYHGNFESLRIILEEKPELDYFDKELSPILFKAISLKRTDILDDIMEAGANILIKDYKGKGIIEHAEAYGDREIIDWARSKVMSHMANDELTNVEAISTPRKFRF